ncbi:MAG TPA: serine/threonine-protein kinase [Polyangiales bacterium]|nr:serine/threonine-protein kinase [Polyangiales bacterium]
MSVNQATGDGGATHALERLGRYALLAPLGQGGMSTLHLAVAGGLGEFRKLVVLKELRRDLARSVAFVDMFMAEAKLAARMNHPNIVQSIEAEQDQDRYFLALEFLDGQPLNEVLKTAATEANLPLHMLLHALCETLAGLHYAHELSDFDDQPLQIVHRDVSPHNIFVTYHGEVKVLDFGVAKAADIEHSTDTGVFKGKFSYASPEQVSCQPVDRRADVFAVGVMLWEVLAGRRFARGPVTQAAIEARLAGTEPRIGAAAPQTPAELARICDRAIDVDPEQRYPSAEAFRADLAAYLQAQGALVHATQVSTWMRDRFAAERAHRHRAIRAWGKQMFALDDFSGSIIRFKEERTPIGNLGPWIERSRADNPAVASVTEVPARRIPLVFWLLLPAAAAIAAVTSWLLAPAAKPPQVLLPAAAAVRAPEAPPAPPVPVAPPPAPVFEQPPASPPRKARAVASRASRRAAPADAARADAPPPAAGAGATEVPGQRNTPVAQTVQLGDDLRTRQNSRQPRRIDSVNPFR